MALLLQGTVPEALYAKIKVAVSDFVQTATAVDHGTGKTENEELEAVKKELESYKRIRQPLDVMRLAAVRPVGPGCALRTGRRFSHRRWCTRRTDQASFP